jgi:hypothetical protein
VLAAIVGFVLAYCLSVLLQWQAWLAIRQLTSVYTIFFVLAWNVVFGFLSFFVFAMGFGDGPAPTSIDELWQRLVGILLHGVPLATLISLVVCSGATAVVAGVLEVFGLARIKQ